VINSQLFMFEIRNGHSCASPAATMEERDIRRKKITLKAGESVAALDLRESFIGEKPKTPGTPGQELVITPLTSP